MDLTCYREGGTGQEPLGSRRAIEGTDIMNPGDKRERELCRGGSRKHHSQTVRLGVAGALSGPCDTVAS